MRELTSEQMRSACLDITQWQSELAMTSESALAAILAANRAYVAARGHNPPFPFDQLPVVDTGRGVRPHDAIIRSRMLACWSVEGAIKELGLGVQFRSWLRRQNFVSPKTVKRTLGTKAEWDSFLKLCRYLTRPTLAVAKPNRSKQAERASAKVKQYQTGLGEQKGSQKDFVPSS